MYIVLPKIVFKCHFYRYGIVSGGGQLFDINPRTGVLFTKVIRGQILQQQKTGKIPNKNTEWMSKRK